jgi:hypothetical protein
MGGMQREGRVESLIRREKVIENYRKMAGRKWEGRGGLLAFAFQETREDGYHHQQR